MATKAAPQASFVLAGDDLQLAPIHPAEPPTDLGTLVGSVYEYVTHHADVAPTPLLVNYRSSAPLVALTRRAGYSEKLEAFHPDLRLAPLPGAWPPDGKPADWPPHLAWSDGWAKLLDPTTPASCFLYDDRTASQANAFEADAVAALLFMLYGRFDQQLAGERGGAGERSLTGQPYKDVVDAYRVSARRASRVVLTEPRIFAR